MKQIGTKQFNSNDVMSLHRDMTAVKTLNETSIEHLLSMSQTQYNKFYMKISVSECTFSDSSLNSPALSFKSIRYSSI